jgi:hypothetical protein
MTLHEEQERVQKAVHNSFSCLREDPWLAQRVLANAKGEESSVRKISVSMLIAIALALLTVTGALAALGLFGQLSQEPRGDKRLSAVDKAAENIDREWTTADGITVRIEQAYYEGSRVFIAYRMRGEWNTTILHEGAPDKKLEWNWEAENTIAAQTMISDIPERQQALRQLNGQGQRWIDCTDIGLHDGLCLTDGTYLDIIGGDEIIQPDGSVIGWKECEIPEDCLQETLTFRAKLYRNHSIQFQDGATYRMAVEKGENTCLDFTLTQNTDLIDLKGEGKGKDYAAVAELSAGHIDLRGKVTVTCPASWIEAWNSWENPENLDMICDWYLCRNGEVMEENGVQGIYADGENRLIFELLYPIENDLEALSLAPVREDGQPRMEEAIRLKTES